MKATKALSHKILTAGQEKSVELLLSFEADAGEVHPRRPLNISLVLDRSGSMGGTKLTQAIRASTMLVDKLSDQDTLSVVAYDDSVDTKVKPQKVADKSAIKEVIKKIRAGGITNLSGGWLKGCDHVKDNSAKGVVNRVLMLTDGQANMGETNPETLTAMSAEQAKAGVVTTTLGFGNGFNEDLLIGMASAGGGNFYFIQSPDDAAEVFRIEVEGLSSLIANSLVVTVEPCGGAAVKAVLNSYPFGSEAGRTSISVGDVYAVEPCLLALEMDLPALAAGEHPIAKVTLNWMEATEGGFEARTSAFDVTARAGSADEALAAGLDAKVIQEASKLRIGNIKEQAIALADKGDLKMASARLRGMIDDIKTRALDEEFEFAEEVEQLNHYANLFDKGQYSSDNRKEIRDQSYQARTRGRSDLKQRGSTSVDTSRLETVTFEEGKEEGGVVVQCVKDGGKLRVRAVSEGYDSSFNVQFPRDIRQEGCRFLVSELSAASNGGFYRASGDIKLLLRPGESRPTSGGWGGGSSSSRRNLQKTNANSLADVPTIDDVGDGVLIQIVKDKSKLRARVVSDGYDPDKNMRFPRGIRKEGVLFVVEDVKPSSDGSYYIAFGKIHRLVQPGDPA